MGEILSKIQLLGQILLVSWEKNFSKSGNIVVSVVGKTIE